MQFSRYIARRFLFSSQLPGAIKTLSLVSMVGMAIGTASLIIVLSVFNGFHGLIYSLFQKIDPEIKIVAVKGRYLPEPQQVLDAVKRNTSVQAFTSVLEGRAILSYHDHQAIVVVRGIEQNFTDVSRIREIIAYGNYNVSDSAGYPHLVVGEGIAAATQINLADLQIPMQIYTITEKANLLNADPNSLQVYPAFTSGIFSVQKEYNDKIVLTNIGFARKLFNNDDDITSIDIKIKGGVDINSVRQSLQKDLGTGYDVQNWEGQHPSLYNILRNEKAISYLVLFFMLILLACTIVGSITMVIIEKQREIAILQSMGATKPQIQAIFVYQGLLSGLISTCSGLLFGGILGFLQQHFGLLKMQGGENFLIDHFPLVMQPSDFILVAATVLTLAVLASLYPALKATQGTVVYKLKS